MQSGSSNLSPPGSQRFLGVSGQYNSEHQQAGSQGSVQTSGDQIPLPAQYDADDSSQQVNSSCPESQIVNLDSNYPNPLSWSAYEGRTASYSIERLPEHMRQASFVADRGKQLWVGMSVALDHWPEDPPVFISFVLNDPASLDANLSQQREFDRDAERKRRWVPESLGCWSCQLSGTAKCEYIVSCVDGSVMTCCRCSEYHLSCGSEGSVLSDPMRGIVTFTPAQTVNKSFLDETIYRKGTECKVGDIKCKTCTDYGHPERCKTVMMKNHNLGASCNQCIARKAKCDFSGTTPAAGLYFAPPEANLSWASRIVRIQVEVNPRMP